MKTEKGFVGIVLLIFVFILIAIGALVANLKTTNNIIPTPTPYQFPYKNPSIPKSQSYRIVIVGDSITASMGLNANLLRLNLIKHYPDSEFVTYNYGYPSTNVLSLYLRLVSNTKNGAQENIAILRQGFELIVIESFGYNPLSEYTLEEGLKKQNEELEKSVREILRQKPTVAIAFLTPIALDPVNFGRETFNLSPDVRKQWVEERITYINNHKIFAENLGIPIIDVYKASLKSNGEVDKKYISDDFVHPSTAGIELISKSIADYIFENKIFPY